jgi:fluoride ion exporter CrcB/FEX
MSEAAVEYLIRVLAIMLGAALGSVIRHAADTGGVALYRGISLLGRLAVTALGSFLAGFFAAHFAQLGISASGSERPVASRVIGVFLVGLVGGFVAFPAFSRDSSAPDPDAEAGVVVFRVVSSLIVTIVFFFVGGLCARMTAA